MGKANICPNCGKINKEEGQFCEDCGSAMNISPGIARPKKKTTIIPELSSDVKLFITIFGYFLVIIGIITGLTIGERPLLPFYGLILAFFIGIFLYLMGGNIRKHGKIIVILVLVAIIIWFITASIFWSGPYAPRDQYGALYG